MGIPLPTKLAGISVRLQQSDGPQGPFEVPIFRVQFLDSTAFDPGSTYTAVTIQVPFELSPNTTANSHNVPLLTVSDGVNSTPGTVFGADTTAVKVVSSALHADGKPVTIVNPARPGEDLVVYAIGLGLPGYPFPTNGDVFNEARPVNIALNYDYRANASPSKAGKLVPYRDPDPYVRYVGTSPGSIGLYQANFVVPVPPAGLLACRDGGDASNLTVTLAGQSSFDGVGICVTPP
jgi:uncharacterized protein (TIGR03437 family)